MRGSRTGSGESTWSSRAEARAELVRRTTLNGSDTGGVFTPESGLVAGPDRSGREKSRQASRLRGKTRDDRDGALSITRQRHDLSVGSDPRRQINPSHGHGRGARRRRPQDRQTRCSASGMGLHPTVARGCVSVALGRSPLEPCVTRRFARGRGTSGPAPLGCGGWYLLLPSAPNLVPSGGFTTRISGAGLTGNLSVVCCGANHDRCRERRRSTRCARPRAPIVKSSRVRSASVRATDTGFSPDLGSATRRGGGTLLRERGVA